MNKPLPWNVKGVGFDAREAARLAAKRAGVPLGDWLNGIISARAAELGVKVDDVESDDRLDAIAARLSDDEAGGRTARLPAAKDRFGFGRPVDTARPERQRELVATAAMASGHSEAAARVDARVGSSAVYDSAQGAAPARFTEAPAPAAMPATQGQAALDTLPRSAELRRTAQARRAPDRIAPAQAEANLLDDRLNAILTKLNRSFEAAAGIESAATLRSVMHSDAKEPPPTVPVESTEREPKPTALVARPETAPAEVVTGSATPTLTPETGSFADLQAAFRSLAEKLEAQVSDTQAGRVLGRPAEMLSVEHARRAVHSRLPDEPKPDPRVEDLKRLQRELAQLASRVAELTPQNALASLESAVRELAGRVDLSKLDGVQASLLAPVERLGHEMREAIRSTDATQAVEMVRRDLKVLGAKLDAQPARGPDAQALESLEGEIRDMREAVAGLAEQMSATEHLQAEISALGDRVGLLADRTTPSVSRELAQAIGDIRTHLRSFTAEGVFGVFGQKIDDLAAHVASIAEARHPDAFFTNLVRQIDRANETLIDRLDGRMAPPADFSGLEDRIGSLSAKIESMGRTSQDMSALYGLVGNLADRVQDARDPAASGDALTALQSQIGQLMERLDRSETSSASLQGVERLIGDLFLQIEQSRNVAIDAAENAARAAAQDTLRAALDNPTLNGAELTVQTGLDVDHVSLELAELRRVQEASDRRITTTLTALNTTLERLVDHMTAAPPAPAPVVEDERPADKMGRRRRRMASEAESLDRRSFGDIPPFDPEQFLIEPGHLATTASAPLRAKAAESMPVPQVGTDTAGSVAPLIAAARRAAQAAQASAMEAALSASPETAGAEGDARSGKVRSFFATRRRPLLLGLAGLVLLLGTLQIVRLSTQRDGGEPSPTGSEALSMVPSAPKPVAMPAKVDAISPKPDVKGASLLSPPAAIDGTAAGFTRALPMDPVPTASAAPPIASTADTGSLPGIGQGLRDAAAGGSAAAQFEIAVRLSDGRGVARDPKQAALWFERSANQGFAPAQYRLGSVYEKGVGTSADPALAVAWYEKAATQGNVRAMHNLAVMSAEGAGSKPDYGKAVTWFTKAATYGVRDSQYNLAVLLARGLGVPQNLEQSYTWFAAAAAQGDADAVTKRDTVAAKLDPKALADAKTIVVAFHPMPPDAAANNVQPPPGGWDAMAPAKTADAARKTEARITSM